MKTVSRQRCKKCIQYEGFNGFDELGYCDDCRHSIVECIINDLTKPLYVWRMAHGAIQATGTTDKMLRSARTRVRQAERDIIRILSLVGRK